MCRLTLCVVLLTMAMVVAEESEEIPKLRVLVAKRQKQRLILTRLYTNPDHLHPAWTQIGHVYVRPGEMSYFSAYNKSHGAFTRRITVCNYFLSSLITDGEDCSALDESAVADFSFYVSDTAAIGTDRITYKDCYDLTTNISYSVISNRTAECGRYSTEVKSGDFYAFPGKLFCRPPDMLRNSIAIVLHRTYEDEVHLKTITFDCKPGYVVQHATIVCLDGQWRPRQTRCEVVNCGEPAIANGHPRSTTFVFPQTTSYVCDEGYTLSPPNASIQCQASGNWAGTFGECKPVNCGPPEPIAHGHYVGSVYTYGHKLTSVCEAEEGYRDGFYARPEIECTADGTWRGSTARCYIIRCMSPNYITNGRAYGHGYQYGRTVSFECNEGYTLVGHSTITCGRRLDMSTPTGAWIGFIPSCEPSA